MTNDAEGYIPGSFNWYLYRSGNFVTAMAHAIQRADQINCERLRKAYPQMVAAHEQPDWNTPPHGFNPHYQSEQGITT